MSIIKYDLFNSTRYVIENIFIFMHLLICCCAVFTLLFGLDLFNFEDVIHDSQNTFVC